jgi:hypothetical protein
MQIRIETSPFQAVVLRKQDLYLQIVQEKLTNSVSMAAISTLVYPYQRKRYSAISFHQNHRQVRLMYDFPVI